ncbi:MAG: tocopherol cyclase family protein [Bacteroidota bacterium]
MTSMTNNFRRWRALWHPEMYHGWGRQNGYFEGWYFKLVDFAERFAFAVIPGISMGKDEVRHAFIQVLDGKRCVASYHEFPLETFLPGDQEFSLELGGNFFSTQKIRLDLPELSGEIHFKNTTPWPKMLGAPGIMGWYSFVPFMQCYHGVVSLNHDLTGQMKVYGEAADFSGGKGYIEKDWGESFPRSWIWLQSNHFEAKEPVSLMASVAHIPWLGSYFIGFIVGFLVGKKLHRFATYTGAKMKAAMDERHVYLTFKDSRFRLEITGTQAPGAKLVSPITGNMTGKVNESMLGVIHVQLFENERLVFEGTGRNAGMEIAGDVQELLVQK